ncbi:MAG: carboxypeptidase-like regulatory domain-containing protein [Parachlamydia sp.]|nr:carboxypeptidase-like regulatory domain-containing protein [Parachlamydia sp.]
MSLYKLFLFFILALGVLDAEEPMVKFTNTAMMNLEPGSLLPISAYITSDQPQLLCQLQLPEGWESLNPAESLQDGGVYLNAVQVPEKTAPGIYTIRLLVGHYYFDRLQVPVGIKDQLLLKINEIPTVLTNGESFPLNLTYCNAGNQHLNISLELKGESLTYQCPCEPLCLAPGEKHTHDFLATIAAANETSERAFLFIQIKNNDTGEIIERRTLLFDIVPLGTHPADPFIRIPATLRFAAEKIGDEQVIFAAFEGEGMLDEAREIATQFYVQLPFYHLDISAQEAASFSWNFTSPEWEMMAGDNGYSLGPLSEEYWFARGAMLTLLQENFDAGLFYAQDIFQDDCFRREGGLLINWQPYEQLKVGGSYLCKQYLKQTAHIGEVDFEFSPSPSLNLTANLARNFKGSQRGRFGYRVHLKGNGWNESTYAIEKIYLGKNLWGSYDGHLNQLNGYIDQPISCHYSANFGFNFLRYTFNHKCCNRFREEPIMENSLQGQVNYYNEKGFTFAFTSQYFRAQDLNRSCEFNFRQVWGGFKAGLLLHESYINFLTSFGLEHNLKNNKKNFLQRYAVNFNNDLSSYLKLNLFFEFGNINLFKAHAWRYAVGSQLSWQISSRTFLSLFAQTNRYSRTRHWNGQFAFNFYHLFDNEHRFDFNIQKVSHPRHQCHLDEMQYLISYTIPLDILVDRKRNQGEIEGRLFKASTQEPISRALVKINDQSVLTDREGRFSFKGVPAGLQQFKTEKIPGNQTTPYIESSPISAKGGKTVHIEVPIYESSLVEGQIIYFNQMEISQIENLSGLAELPFCYGGTKENTSLQLENLTDHHVRYARTDSSGFFSFPKLYPGQWQLTIDPSALPQGYRLRSEAEIIELEENQVHRIHLEIIPENTKAFHVLDYPTEIKEIKN